MTIDIPYSFDDVPVTSFYYDYKSDRIEIGFDEYYDNTLNRMIEEPCLWFISGWSKAWSRPYNTSNLTDLDMQLGFFWLILILEKKENKIFITAENINGSIIEMVFEDAQIGLINKKTSEKIY